MAPPELISRDVRPFLTFMPYPMFGRTLASDYPFLTSVVWWPSFNSIGLFVREILASSLFVSEASLNDTSSLSPIDYEYYNQLGR